MYLFDTNIISELTKRQCNPQVLSFVEQTSQHNAKVFLSVITVGEIVKGIEKLRARNDISQAYKLQLWYDNELSTVIDDVLPFNERCARVWGELLARNPHNAIDKQLVATVLVHNLTFVTRNTKDVENTGVKLLNPFIEL